MTTEPQEEVYLKAYFGDSLDDYKCAQFFLMQQVCLMFYAMGFMRFATVLQAKDSVIDDRMETVRHRDFAIQIAKSIDRSSLLKDIHLQVSSGDRIAVAGMNGSGKSCLVKAILRIESTSAFLQGGNVQLTDMQTAYLDQSYELVERTQTVLENMHRANPVLNYQLLRQQLGHFLFFNDDVYKSALVLSGGELARLAIAMITISELDLLILDEPTNNLDIATVDQMVEALNKYQGALWVISHDLDFLSRINITRSFHLKHQTFQPTVYLPSQPFQYHNELKVKSSGFFLRQRYGLLPGR